MFQEGSRGPAYISYVLKQDYVRVPSRGECEDPECLAGGCLVQVDLDNYQALVTAVINEGVKNRVITQAQVSGAEDL